MNRRDFFKRMGGAALTVPLAVLGLLGLKERAGVGWYAYHSGAILNSSFGQGLRVTGLAEIKSGTGSKLLVGTDAGRIYEVRLA